MFRSLGVQEEVLSSSFQGTGKCSGEGIRGTGGGGMLFIGAEREVTTNKSCLLLALEHRRANSSVLYLELADNLVAVIT